MSPASYRAAPPRVDERNVTSATTTNANRLRGRATGTGTPGTPLRGELLPQRVPQPGRPLRPLRRSQRHRAVRPALTLGELAPTRVDEGQPERRPPVPGVGGPRPPHRGLRLAALPGQQQPEVE